MLVNALPDPNASIASPAALVVIVTYLFQATDQSSPTTTAVGTNTGF